MGELSTMAKEKVREAKPYCGNVRTIRFNAWHYVDADLWASLAATLFDELARPTAAEEANEALVALGKARAEADQAKASRIKLERGVDVLEKRTGTAYAAWRPSLAVALHAIREDKGLQSNLPRPTLEYIAATPAARSGNARAGAP